MPTRLSVERYVALTRSRFTLTASQAVTDLLRFYVIFRPAEAKEGVPISPCQTVLAKTMDDALQYRCAGTVQAAIEKYIDHIGGKPPMQESDASSVLSNLDDEPKKDKKGEPCELGRTTKLTLYSHTGLDRLYRRIPNTDMVIHLGHASGRHGITARGCPSQGVWTARQGV